MASVNESTAPSAGLAAALAAGIDSISAQAETTFFTYTRRVLPLDGYVFWLLTGTFTETGMLHHSVDRDQQEDDTATTGSVVFSTMTQIVQLNHEATDTLIVGIAEGEKYAFKAHGYFNANAGIWHYHGDSIQAPFETQFIDDPGQLKPDTLIVSDSLPAWLALATYSPIWLLPANPRITLYPSFLVPDNLPPPYGTVHIEPQTITALQASPLLQNEWLPQVDGRDNPVVDGNGDPVLRPATLHTQLTSESVRVTLYGCDNGAALDFLDLVLSYSRDTDIIGMMNMPVVRDDKRTWPAGMILAKKKIIDFQVSYLQNRTINQAQQLITLAQTTVASFKQRSDFLAYPQGGNLLLSGGGGLILEN